MEKEQRHKREILSFLLPGLTQAEKERKIGLTELVVLNRTLGRLSPRRATLDNLLPPSASNQVKVVVHHSSAESDFEMLKV
ncbi:hypothetical protein T02_8823 [Trichinella nativa]|uniref:Uncharacterized protein n=1 Tax=Trichinella nativa TaxID=6335 RepID=A0A0V1L731_9BILA|nr:hypothetical protein T02_8823 [Trichinella nativa]